ncbi:histone-lysine N-methyltransferase SETMAR [Trichonephila clavipes]|nr:histone-lysine N-methyltransferase SETMAR [Trichonephila clavipes]
MNNEEIAAVRDLSINYFKDSQGLHPLKYIPAGNTCLHSVAVTSQALQTITTLKWHAPSPNCLLEKYIYHGLHLNSHNRCAQTAEIVNRVSGADIVTANYVQFWFRRFCSGIFDVKDAPHTGRSVVEDVDKISELIEVDRHVSSSSIAQDLKIDHKTVLNHLCKVGFKKKFDVWVPHQLTPRNMMDRISICKALAKRNEIDPFLKRMVTGDEKWIT